MAPKVVAYTTDCYQSRTHSAFVLNIFVNLAHGFFSTPLQLNDVELNDVMWELTVHQKDRSCPLFWDAGSGHWLGGDLTTQGSAVFPAHVLGMSFDLSVPAPLQDSSRLPALGKRFRSRTSMTSWHLYRRSRVSSSSVTMCSEAHPCLGRWYMAQSRSLLSANILKNKASIRWC